jgi:ABC-type branched-subunit amino acid transport system ATPase component
MTEALAIAGLQTGYGDTKIIEDATLDVAAGEIFALLGKNGAGKTTLLRAIMGLRPVWSGSVSIFGSRVEGWRTDRIAGLGVSYAPQERAFFPDLTVDENLRLGSLGVAERVYQSRRERAVGYFPFIATRMKQRAGSLSGGEQSMLKVARAVLPEPRLILLDEISEGLQPLAVDRVRDCLVAERETRGLSIVLVEQNIDFVWRLAQRYGLIGRNRVVGQGALSDDGAIARVAEHLAI